MPFGVRRRSAAFSLSERVARIFACRENPKIRKTPTRLSLLLLSSAASALCLRKAGRAADLGELLLQIIHRLERTLPHSRQIERPYDEERDGTYFRPIQSRSNAIFECKRLRDRRLILRSSGSLSPVLLVGGAD